MNLAEIIPIGGVDREILDFLARRLSRAFALPFVVREVDLDPASTYSEERGQFHSTELLARLLECGSTEAARVLGVADVDLYIPILTFVFGEAQLGNRAALMSVHRLRQEFYGLPPNAALFRARTEKEAIHELGHAFGLVHCRDFECVMHFSNSIEQVDLKRNEFCVRCAEFVRQALPSRDPERPGARRLGGDPRWPVR